MFDKRGLFRTDVVFFKIRTAPTGSSGGDLYDHNFKLLIGGTYLSLLKTSALKQLFII